MTRWVAESLPDMSGYERKAIVEDIYSQKEITVGQLESFLSEVKNKETKVTISTNGGVEWYFAKSVVDYNEDVLIML